VTKAPRVALGGFAIECNRSAEPATRADFDAGHWLQGAALMQALRADPPLRVGEPLGFIQAMDDAAPWQPVPLLDVASHPKGPVQQALFEAILQQLIRSLQTAQAEGGVDAVFLALHGAAITAHDADPEGTLLWAVRQCVGAAVPVVATLDLHANVSPRMVQAADALVVFRTNPHVDMHACGGEAAALLQRMLAEPTWRPARALLRLPLLAPTLTMLTAPGSGPFAEMMSAALEAQAQGEALAAAVLGSFPHSDTPDIGLAVLVHADDCAQATAVAQTIADIGWRARAAFDPHLTGPTEALAMLQEAHAAAHPARWLLADLGDNPGGGAPATDLSLLAALLPLMAAGGRRAVAGLLHAPELAERAHALGLGAELLLPGLAAAPFAVSALSDGRCVGRRGLLAGAPIRLGPTAAVSSNGLTLVISSERFSPNDPVCFEHLGLALTDFDVIVLKSRGHFRAGFDEFVAPQHIVEVATAGVTSPDLRRVRWQQRPVPVFPLDGDMGWSAMKAMLCTVGRINTSPEGPHKPPGSQRPPR
jgi:microcystin degradation protein MlrC